jgi:cytochrome oxidase Cu insertion factor (SCO1/SenC/PrrC family)
MASVRALAAGAAIGALLLAVPAAAEDQPSAAQLMDDLMWNRGPIGGPFALIDHTGKPRTDADFRGKLLVVYFGYTYCPDICPGDLLAISQALDRLGAAAQDVQPIFITVDPERDTVEHLADYVSAFHQSLVGLTGAPDAIRKVATAYKAYYAKVESADRRDADRRDADHKDADHEDYVVDHTAFIYLVGKDGQYLGFLPPSTTPERLGEVIRQQLSR